MAGLFNWGARKTADAPAAGPQASSPDRTSSDRVTTSKVLPKMLSALTQASAPVLMDLGPVVGQNIAFFGEQLSCKIFVEDLFAEVEAHAARQALDALPEAFARRMTREPGTIDGILCWDLFDYLDRAAGHALAARLTALLRRGGILYGFFGTAPVEVTYYTRFVVEAADTLRLRHVPATPTRRQVRVTRDINKMFEGLATVESVLLKTSTRETLFRKR